MTTQDPAEQSTPPTGFPAPQPPPHRQSAPPVNRMLLLGLIIGLVVGAGGVGLAWGLNGGSGASADARAVCGIVARTPDPPANLRDISTEYARRWSVGDVAASIAATDATYQPLADSLRDVLRTVRSLNPDRMRDAIGKAKQVCADL